MPNDSAVKLTGLARHLVLDNVIAEESAAEAFQNAKKYVPYYIFAVGFMIAMVTLLKGLKHVGVELDFGLGSKFANCIPPAAAIGLVVAMLGKLLLTRIKEDVVSAQDNRFANVERVLLY